MQSRQHCRSGEDDANLDELEASSRLVADPVRRGSESSPKIVLADPSRERKLGRTYLLVEIRQHHDDRWPRLIMSLKAQYLPTGVGARLASSPAA
jgi:hypothetical protein